LVAIKAAMFEVSNWLVEVERINRQRQTLMDKDLESIVNDTLLADINNFDIEDNADGEDEEDASSPPPSYSELLGLEEVQNEIGEGEEFGNFALHTTQSPPPPFQKTAEGLYNTTRSSQVEQEGPIENRTQLIFDALVDQRNNNARWLGSNSKLTRLKFYGGLSTLLKLQVEWPQFDMLWTKLDSKRSGDLDIHEFKKYFNLDADGVHSDDMDGDAQKELKKCLFELCNQLRRAGMTLKEMFAGFDRNASNEISVSEFCSLLKLVLSGGAVDKKLIYHALLSVDSDGSKSISLEELSRMVYGVWRTQLDQLADKLSRIANSEGGSKHEKEVAAAVLKEREVIKEAIKRNFSRPQRDRLESETRSPHLHGLSGPFQALLGRLGLGESYTLTF